ncbi:MAG: hemolysin family protein [Gammaproteobacteria bacterium]|nr:hemolysin family protein [Gammaproteobacteria bacterium]
MESILILLAMVALLLLEGFFSGSEIALVNADKIRLRAKASQGHKGAKLALTLFEKPDVLLTTTLVGTNISVVLLTTLGTLLMIRWFGERGDLYAVLIYTPLLLTFGEIVPKSVYQQKADSLAPIVVYPLRAFKALLYPVIMLFSMVARFAARLAGRRPHENNLFITREQFRSIVEMAAHSSNVDVFDRERIKRAIRFADTTVAEAMVPLAEVRAVNRSHGTAKAIKEVRDHGYNRLPIYEGNVANVIGIVTLTLWDLMDEELSEKSLLELNRPALYVSPLQKIDELLPVLRERHDHMAVVVDEFGSAIGIITMEDILEEVVGELNVGYDFDEYRPKRKRQYENLEDGIFLIDSRVPVSEVNELLEINLPATEFYTLGGFVEARLRRIPKKGESVVDAGWRFIVSEATERAILKLRVERL